MRAGSRLAVPRLGLDGAAALQVKGQDPGTETFCLFSAALGVGMLRSEKVAVDALFC